MALSLAFKDLALYGLTLALAFLLVLPFLTSDPNKPDHDALVGDKRENNSSSGRDDTATNTATSRTTTNTIMQAPREDLPPPKDDPFTLEELKAFDGSDASKPVYVAIKGTLSSSSSSLPLFSYLNCQRPGTVFDVSRKRETYGPGGSYAVFAGKDGSRGLGLSSLEPENAVPDWSTLEEKDRKTLDDWHAFFTCVPFLSPVSASPL